MNIEKMSERDLVAVTELAEQLGYTSTVEEVSNRFAEIQKNPRASLFVAKLESGKVVGFIQVIEESRSIVVGPRADVAALVVDQNHRSQGIGRTLLKSAEQWAKDHELPLVRVRSNTKRQDAYRFYKREGYDHSKTSNIFTKSLL